MVNKGPCIGSIVNWRYILLIFKVHIFVFACLHSFLNIYYKSITVRFYILIKIPPLIRYPENFQPTLLLRNPSPSRLFGTQELLLAIYKFICNLIITSFIMLVLQWENTVYILCKNQ